MIWIVNSQGIRADTDEAADGDALTLEPGATVPEARADALPGLLRIRFAAMGDGRGFSLARRLRARGYAGRLRAAGPLVADQFAALARVGFDEVEVSDTMRARLPPDARLVGPGGYRERLTGDGGLSGGRETG